MLAFLGAGAIAHQHRLRTICTIRSYNYTKLQLGYGPQYESLVSIRWCADRRGFRLAFARLNATTTNPHTAIATELEAQLNRHFSIAQLVHLLHETYRPISALGMLDIIPHYGIPVRTFYPLHTVSYDHLRNSVSVASHRARAHLLFATTNSNAAASRLPSHLLSGAANSRRRYGIDPGRSQFAFRQADTVDERRRI